MSENDRIPPIQSRIWHEEAEPDNPFAARAAYCRGYDVYGEMVGNARWVEMVFLLFRPELPQPHALDVFEALAVALANPGPRDPAVHAAMCGGVGGSTAAASLIAALSVGAGRYGGARDVYDAMRAWSACGDDVAAWPDCLISLLADDAEAWPAAQHPAGCDPHGVSTPATVVHVIQALAKPGVTPRLSWLAKNCSQLPEWLGCPLAMSGVAAAAFADLGFSPEEGEMLHLLLRLPGAAAHSLEQAGYGYRKFPFYSLELEEPLNGNAGS